MIETFLFLRLGEEVVCWNVAFLQKYCEGEEGDDEDRKPVCTDFNWKKDRESLNIFE